MCTVGDDDDLTLRLLRDIKSIWDGQPVEITAVPSSWLVNKLHMMLDAPWADGINHGKGLTQNLLARWLKNFGIHPADARFPAGTLRAYFKSEFEDVWRRYE
jgi:hypothetical protein